MEQLGTSDYLHFSTGSEGIINDVLAKNKEDTFDSDISKELVENFFYIAQSFFKKRGVSLTFEELIKKLKVTETSEVNFLKNLLRDAFRLDSIEAFLYVLRQCIDLVSDGVSQFKEEDIVERLSSERLVNDCFRNPKEFIHTCIDVAIELSDKNGDMCNRRYFVQLKDKVDKTPNFAKEFLIGFGLREFVQLALESPKKAYAFVLNRVAEKINWENGEFDYIKSMDVCESLNKALNVIHEKKVKEVEALASKALLDFKKAFELKKIAGILFNIYLKKNPPSNSISHYNMPNYCYGDESYQ